MKKLKKGKGIIFLVILLIILIIVAGVLLFFKMTGTQMKNANQQYQMQVATNETYQEEEAQIIEMKEPQIFQGTDRPIAVMIDNHEDALPQGGLNDAYLVYEIIVEGGESRLMALFKGKDLEKIGPVRSARHYFLDYALENDAIYVHFGESPQAKSDIKKLGVDAINGIYESSTAFWRTKDKYAPHNVATSTEQIKKIAKADDYVLTSTKDSVLNYSVNSVDLGEDAQNADKVIIPYCDWNVVTYTYNPETKRYNRNSKGIDETDWTTGEAVTTKNIIIEKAKNTTLNDGENKGRQTLDNIKILEGYYITEGKAIPITCEKTSRSSQTIYKDLEGNEIEVNDGNTFIQICPINAEVEIIGTEPAVEEQQQENVVDG